MAVQLCTKPLNCILHVGKLYGVEITHQYSVFKAQPQKAINLERVESAQVGATVACRWFWLKGRCGQASPPLGMSFRIELVEGGSSMWGGELGVRDKWSVTYIVLTNRKSTCTQILWEPGILHKVLHHQTFPAVWADGLRGERPGCKSLLGLTLAFCTGVHKAVVHWPGHLSLPKTCWGSGMSVSPTMVSCASPCNISLLVLKQEQLRDDIYDSFKLQSSIIFWFSFF